MGKATLAKTMAWKAAALVSGIGLGMLSYALHIGDLCRPLRQLCRTKALGHRGTTCLAGVMVRSQIIKASGEPVKVDYMMRHNGEAWLISDIYLDGAISEVATRRSEFSTILKNEGIDGLIAALNRKADILTGTTAKAL